MPVANLALGTSVMPLQALIFDVDGTIANTERDGHRVAFNLAFDAAGLNWTWSEVLYGELLIVAGGKERIRYFIEQYQPEMPVGLSGDRGDEAALTAWIADLHRAKTETYCELLAEGTIPARTGVVRLLKEARSAGVRLAIATTSALPNVLALLSTAVGPGSVDWFDLIAAGDIVAHKKPAPDVYQYVLTQMDLDPAHCVVFEDSWQGLNAATGAGLRTIVTANRYTQSDDFSSARLVLNHLGDPNVPMVVAQGLAQGEYLTVDWLQRWV
jgi:HAD superfamily hydrolase (TIGR01509 family)